MASKKTPRKAEVAVAKPKAVAAKKKAAAPAVTKSTESDLRGVVDAQRRVGPTKEALKERFQARKIPLAGDFADLIDIADCGRRAIGQSPDQNGRAGTALHVGTDGRLGVIYGQGLMVDTGNGLRVDFDRVLPRGMIVMWSGGNTAPNGWAFCDGTQGTPDLQDRFILAGRPSLIGGQSTNAAAGASTFKTYQSTNVGSTAPAISSSIQVAGTRLTEQQIPSHSHTEGMRLYSASSGIALNSVYQYGLTSMGDITMPASPLVNTPSLASSYAYTRVWGAQTSRVGSDEAHGHEISASVQQAAHTHKVDVMPPYYILAFIMKIGQ